VFTEYENELNVDPFSLYSPEAFFLSILLSIENYFNHVIDCRTQFSSSKQKLIK